MIVHKPEEPIAILIFPWAGSRPEVIDSENLTKEEVDVLASWQAITDNNDGLKGKIDRVDEWLLEGDFTEIIDPKIGVMVTKAGQFGIAVGFPVYRILKPDPIIWFTNKVSQLREAGWQLRGFIAASLDSGLVKNGYTKVVVEEG